VKLAVIRHGDSHHSAQGIIAGPRTCPGLTSHGIAQSQLLADRLRRSGELSDCSIVLVSPVARAIQTAEALSGVLPAATFIEDRRLIEIDPGNVDGMTYDDYRRHYGIFDPASHPDRWFAPDGETWNEFRARIRSLLSDLACRYDDQTIVAVAHAGTIVAILLELFGIPRPGTGARFEPVHTSITTWRHNDAWILESYNDALHLRAGAFSRG